MARVMSESKNMFRNGGSVRGKGKPIYKKYFQSNLVCLRIHFEKW